VRVNGRLVPLSRVLKSGDQVDVITSKNSKPSSNWLDFVKTSRARSIIKATLNEERKQVVEEGKEILRRKLRQLKITLNQKALNYMMRFFKMESTQDLYYRVGLGTLHNSELKEFATAYNNTLLNFFKSRISKKPKTPLIAEDKDQITQNFDTLVFGKEKQTLAHSFAACCNPIPGDAVFGFITVNEGVKVHAKECPNALALQSNFAYRIVSAKWVDSSAEDFHVTLNLSGIDNLGLVNEVTRTISDNKQVYITKINFDTEDNYFTGELQINVKNQTILNKLIKSLHRIQGIDKIIRK